MKIIKFRIEYSIENFMLPLVSSERYSRLMESFSRKLGKADIANLIIPECKFSFINKCLNLNFKIFITFLTLLTKIFFFIIRFVEPNYQPLIGSCFRQFHGLITHVISFRRFLNINFRSRM